MEDLNTSRPLFKKIDRAVFVQIDKFKNSSNYVSFQDFYNGLDEEQQKIFKAVASLLLILIPALFLGVLLWQNNSLRSDLDLRTSLMEKSLEIIGQKESLQQVEPQILSPNPIETDSMLTSRLGAVLPAAGIDTSRIPGINGFTSQPISTTVFRSEADIQFANASTDELMNIFTALIVREKFRIQSVDIKRSPESNLLSGQFHAVHFSSTAGSTEEE